MTARGNRVVVVLLAVALLVAAGLMLRDGSSSASDAAETPSSDAPGTATPTPRATATPTPRGTATATPSGPPAPAPTPPAPDARATPVTSGAAADPAFVADVTGRVGTVLDAVTDIGDTSGTTLDSLGVTGAFRSEVEAERLEFAAEGWTREGSYVLSDVHVLAAEPTDDPTVLLLSACVDASSVTVRRADGATVGAPAGTPATTYFSLERDGADWVVAGRSYPNDPRCDQ